LRNTPLAAEPVPYYRYRDNMPLDPPESDLADSHHRRARHDD
jgi:hypothetical protein